ncbi:MAG TPA: hypothetical protein VE736_11795 [Gaiellaceae bacterium]|nr:hypothetical protein [Gaiellaceae bacterium]
MDAGTPTNLVPRWAALLLGGVATALVPWTLFLTYVLPAHHVTNHWRLAWAGFDLGLASALVTTAVGVVRNAPWLEGAAAVATTLLVTDAWFDVVLAHGNGERLEAIALAAAGELPLALFCLWIALNAERALRTLKPDRG